MLQLMIEATADNRTICRPIGDLDMMGAQLLRRAAAGLVTTDGSLVIDLSDVTFIDSALLSALVGLARRSAEGAGNVSFVGPRRSVVRVLNMTSSLGSPPMHQTASDPFPQDANTWLSGRRAAMYRMSIRARP